MLKHFIIAFFLVLSVNAYSQKVNKYDVLTTVKDSLSTREKIKRMQYHTTVGTSFFFSPSFASGNSTYIAPELTYSLNSKWSLFGGMRFSYTQLMGQDFSEESSAFNTRSFPGLSVYGGASYQLNEKLSFYGSGIRHMNNFYPNNPTGVVNESWSSYSFGSVLHLGKNVSIGASIHISEGNPYASPYRRNGFTDPYSPFYW